jgi:hypothetical protein
VKDDVRAVLCIVLLFVVGAGAGIGLYDLGYTRHLRQTIERYEAAVARAEEEIKNFQEQIELKSKEIERLTNENISKMSPADVVSTYLTDDTKRLLYGSDPYTRRIVDKVFEFLGRFIEGD